MANTLKSDEAKQVKEKIQSLDSQIEALAERIAQLPKALPAGPFYQQMEKILHLKKQTEERLEVILRGGEHKDIPTEIPQFETFLSILNTFAEDPVSTEARSKIIQRIVHKIEITPNCFKLHFHVGRDYIDGELPSGLFASQKAYSLISASTRYTFSSAYCYAIIRWMTLLLGSCLVGYPDASGFLVIV